MSIESQIREHERDLKLRFLFTLHKMSGGDYIKSFNPLDIGAELGLESEETNRIEQYWVDEGMIERPAMTRISLSHEGLKFIEGILSG